MDFYPVALRVRSHESRSASRSLQADALPEAHESGMRPVSVGACQDPDGAWLEPRALVQQNGQGLTREEWERVKAAVDRLFVQYDETWPVDAEAHNARCADSLADWLRAEHSRGARPSYLIMAQNLPSTEIVYKRDVKGGEWDPIALGKEIVSSAYGYLIDRAVKPRYASRFFVDAGGPYPTAFWLYRAA